MSKAGIFISYRRADSIAWAGRLFADLSERFDRSQVFMDINGGIPRGAQFEDTLREALSSCDALLALIGPQWVTCTRSDGRRKLDVPDDWVRNEIAAALARKIAVVPVLLGKATLPAECDLPDDLRLLRGRQQAEIDDSRWDYDVGELIKDLLKLTSLKPVRNDVASADTGIRLLRDLIAELPAVSDAVGRSKEVIENTLRQVTKLDVFKRIHDALHSIEFDCFRPMQAGGAAVRLRPFKVRFSAEARRIQESVQGNELNAALRDDLVDQLQLTIAAFQTAVDAPGPDAYVEVIGELSRLLSSLPARLDSSMVDAAAELNLDRLVDLMTTVRSKLPPAGPGGASELEPFMEGVAALGRLREELTRRVMEHTQLQRLDSKLRAVCEGGIGPGAAVKEWSRIKLVRSRLVPPFLPEVEAVIGDLVSMEAELDAAATAGSEQEVQSLMREYFRSVSSVFRDADRGLLAFSMRLSAVSQPLKMILAMG